jgi:hypothetical protein
MLLEKAQKLWWMLTKPLDQELREPVLNLIGNQQEERTLLVGQTKPCDGFAFYNA